MTMSLLFFFFFTYFKFKLVWELPYLFKLIFF